MSLCLCGKTTVSLPENPLAEPQPSLEMPPAPPARDPVWSGWDVLMILVVAILGIFTFGTTISVVLMITGHNVSTGSPVLLRVVLLAQFLAYVTVLLFMHERVVRRYRRHFAEAVHWHWPRENRWLAYLLGGMALAVVVQLVSALLPIPKTLPIDKYFQTRDAAYMMSLFGISMAPLVEELFFRGFLFPVLARRLGVTMGIVLTAFGFALVHASQLASAWAPLLVLFLVGLVFTTVRVVTRNVAPGFLMHVGYNFMLFALLYFATDHFRHMERMLQQ
ncbi:MAG TPA: type II CAAX endopeptidase family protein [Terriglobales bacterium]|nr:type II CAAX endopeptidase family protein [Terriglobales bacterium]